MSTTNYLRMNERMTDFYSRLGKERLETVAKAEVAKAVAIKELETQAETWERKASKGAYGSLDPDLVAYYTEKARAARRAVKELKGEATAEQAQPAKPQSVTLPGTWRPQGRR